MPSFSMTPARMTEPAVGAWVWAWGSHVCSGKIGTFTANAMANDAKSQRAVVGGEVGLLARSSTRSKVSRPPFCCAEQEGRGQDADEHEGRAGHGEQEELDRRVHAVARSPSRR